jgi:hypothetical protein
MTSFVWSQESQQEKLEERKAQIQKKFVKMKVTTIGKKKKKSAVNVVVIQSTKIKLKEKLITTTEKQTKLLKTTCISTKFKLTNSRKSWLNLRRITQK